FIETCDDWVVPYIGGLLGTTLLPNPVGQSNRRDVRSTVLWRRSKGTPRMLTELARSTTGWSSSFAEFFQVVAWVQNVNHLRPAATRPRTPSTRSSARCRSSRRRRASR